eukprot:TRINITY_DN32591_c0_g1_i1.p1 TRINITY_DN32591_c0_g1~~TRINITY_DN32591_c0_g1_i1.p1  ORF type:complete len:414 (+),score=99.35 TRINITY_DN32591_c0_g1_i1:77-1243(+)
MCAAGASRRSSRLVSPRTSFAASADSWDPEESCLAKQVWAAAQQQLAPTLGGQPAGDAGGAPRAAPLLLCLRSAAGLPQSPRGSPGWKCSAAVCGQPSESVAYVTAAAHSAGGGCEWGEWLRLPPPPLRLLLTLSARAASGAAVFSGELQLSPDESLTERRVELTTAHGRAAAQLLVALAPCPAQAPRDPQDSLPAPPARADPGALDSSSGGLGEDDEDLGDSESEEEDDDDAVELECAAAAGDEERLRRLIRKLRRDVREEGRRCDELAVQLAALHQRPPPPQPVGAAPPPPPVPPRRSDTDTLGAVSRPGAPQHPASAPRAANTAVALYGYTAQCNGDLTFAAGDTLVVEDAGAGREPPPLGWVHAACAHSSARGLAPVNYLRFSE